MAKVNAPLLSFGASGQIGKAIVYGTWRGISYARQRVIPANPRTTAQSETRGVFRTMSELWTLAPLEWKEVWNAFAAGRPFTGRNRFMGDNVRALRDEPDLEGFIFSPGARGGLPPEEITATGGAESVTVALSIPTAPPGWVLLRSVAIALLDQEPSTTYEGPVGSATATEDPDELTITGLDTAGTYNVGAWLVWEKPNGDLGYSVALSDTATVT